MTDSPIPIWRYAGIATLVLKCLFEDMHVPAVPREKEARPMYLEVRMLGIKDARQDSFQTYPNIQVHMYVYQI